MRNPTAQSASFRTIRCITSAVQKSTNGIKHQAGTSKTRKQQSIQSTTQLNRCNVFRGLLVATLCTVVGVDVRLVFAFTFFVNVGGCRVQCGIFDAVLFPGFDDVRPFMPGSISIGSVGCPPAPWIWSGSGFDYYIYFRL